MKAYKLLILMFFCGELFAEEDSVRMTSFEDKSVYQNLLSCVAKSVNEQNIDEYSKCFLKFERKDKKKLALFFAEHDPSAEIVEHHIIYEDDKAIELAVKYKVSYDEITYVYNSIVFMVNIDSSWKIATEKVIKKTNDQSEKTNKNCFCFGGNCFARARNCPGGNCQINTIDQIFQDIQ